MSLPTHESVVALRSALAGDRAQGRRIACVPTMGALHDGHASLVKAARARCDVVVATIFVNPLQFAPTEDLSRYPRTLESDRRILEDLGTDHLFLPNVETMYPPGFATKVTMTGLTDVLCGKSRPTHFAGVLTVVLKLFNIIQPDVAIFGRKDYQQALIIRRAVRDLDVPVEIVTSPIVREPDGLAMSSRNRYLVGEDRSRALVLRGAVLAMDAAFSAGLRSAAELTKIGHAVVQAQSGVRLDYLELRDPEDLTERTHDAREGDLVAVAAWLGSTRLIDNGLLGYEARRGVDRTAS